MKGEQMPIFRAAAAQRYAESREQAVLPRLVAPRVFLGLWLLLGLLLLAGGLAWSARVPVYVACPAVVVAGSTAMAGDAAVVAFLPPEKLAQVKAGQKLFMQFEASGQRLSQPLSLVDPQILSPAAAQQRFALNAAAASAVTRPSAVALAPLALSSAEPPPAAYLGSVGQVEIEVGSRRLISLLPLAGRLFTEERR